MDKFMGKKFPYFYFKIHLVIQCVASSINTFAKGCKIIYKQVAFQSNTNYPLVESTGYIKFEGM